MTRRSLLGRATLALSALLAPLLVLGATSAASAAPRSDLTYDALGDSYASGYGVGPYYGGQCARSDAAPAVQVEGRMRIRLDDFVACAGATTTSLIAGGQLEALDADTDLVTISIGGNDIGWGEVVAACLFADDATCQRASDASRALITEALPGLLRTVYTQVAERAPEAQVVVTGYAHLFTPQHGDYLGASPAEQRTLNEGADLLNATIAGVAAEYGFTFADVTSRFRGHGVNAPAPWMLPWEDPGRFHPNAAGYRAYTAAVTAAVRPGRIGR